MYASKIRLLTLTALFAALIFLLTAYLHIPSANGYTHIGDAFVYLAGALLPPGYAAAAGAIGAALADLMTGYAFWASASVFIKALTACLFTAKASKILNWRNLLALVPSFVLCVGGYYLYEALWMQNFVALLAGIPGYCTQVVLSSIVYAAVGGALDHLNIKSRLHLEWRKQS